MSVYTIIGYLVLKCIHYRLASAKCLPTRHKVASYLKTRYNVGLAFYRTSNCHGRWWNQNTLPGIRKTYPWNVYPLIPLLYGKTGVFMSIHIFLIFIVGCGYALEPHLRGALEPHLRGGSNVYPQFTCMF